MLERAGTIFIIWRDSIVSTQDLEMPIFILWMIFWFSKSNIRLCQRCQQNIWLANRSYRRSWRHSPSHSNNNVIESLLKSRWILQIVAQNVLLKYPNDGVSCTTWTENTTKVSDSKKLPITPIKIGHDLNFRRCYSNIQKINANCTTWTENPTNVWMQKYPTA